MEAGAGGSGVLAGAAVPPQRIAHSLRPEDECGRGQELLVINPYDLWSASFGLQVALENPAGDIDAAIALPGQYVPNGPWTACRPRSTTWQARRTAGHIFHQRARGIRPLSSRHVTPSPGINWMAEDGFRETRTQRGVRRRDRSNATRFANNSQRHSRRETSQNPGLDAGLMTGRQSSSAHPRSQVGHRLDRLGAD